MSVPNPSPAFKNPVATAYAFGRFFYGVDSYVYFSKVVQSAVDVGKCYQSNDPTSDEISDLVDTDGGVIRLNTAAGIKSITPYRNGVLVFAANGVWYISNPDGGFKATGFSTSKVSEVGISANKSIVLAESSVFYFGREGIQRVISNEFDVVSTEDITQSTIRSLYLDEWVGRSSTKGAYDEANKTIQWWADGDALYLDLRSGGFYPQKQEGARTLARPVQLFASYRYPNYSESPTGTFFYNVATDTNDIFEDFDVAQEAFIVTGYETLGKFANKKAITECSVFLNKTETTIDDYVDGAYVYDLPSSCFMQARWDFDNSNAYKKWVGVTPNVTGAGQPMQMYNPIQRGFIPDSYPYTFDTGESVIHKRASVRGNGKAVQFRFEAEEGKDMQLLGYNVGFSMRGRT